MSNIRDILTNSLNTIEVKVIDTDNEIGNTVRNNYQIYYEDGLVEVEEIIGPDLVVEKFLGESDAFISALAITLCKKFGGIQLCYANKQSKTHKIEIVVYYSQKGIFDEDTRKRMIFFHTQQNLELEYIEFDRLVASSKAYFKANNRMEN